MSNTGSNDSSRNLLFGLLAFQLNFIDRRALLAAFDTWTFDKSRPLGRVLIEQGSLTAELLALIDGLVAAHLSKHDNEPEKSLAALTPIGSMRKELETIADYETRISIAQISVDRTNDDDPYATRAPWVGSPTSSGVRFRVLRPLNAGGMGVVSVALDTELDRSIALKEIREAAADNEAYRARFLAEAEITGKLEHPGIIPIYGLGTYADGRPFYAMRLIRGDKTGSLMETIERFYKETNSAGRVVAFRGLLGRFLDVCNALDYAHSKGVLHRDLKPDNILLGPYGETLVVDWGLAKAAGRADPVSPTDLDRDHVRLNLSGSELSPTLAGGAMGTPGYAPPEQMTGDLDNIGPRSDVYGLGAVLYCLMTGQAPFSRKGMELGALILKIEAGDFPPPRQVRADADKPLEAICLKAMSKKPADRYESVRDLAADMERYLADEPVSAYHEPWSIRARRWTKKHRTAVTSAAATLVVAFAALTVGLIVVGGLNRRLDTAKNHLRVALTEETTARNLAEKRKTVAEEAEKREKISAAAAKSETAKVLGVINVLVNTFRSTDPVGFQGIGFRRMNESGKTLTSLEILDRSAKNIAENLKDQPDVRATLTDTIGDVYRTLYEMERAEPLLKDALRVRQERQGSNSAEVATSWFHLGLFYMDAVKYDEAEKCMRDSLAIRETLFGHDSRESLDVRHYLGLLHLFENDTRSEEELRLIVEAWIKLGSRFERELGLARLGYTAALLSNDRYVPAMVQGRLALAALLDTSQASLAVQAVGKYQLALSISPLPGQARRSEALFLESIGFVNQAFGADHPYSIFMLYGLGAVLEGQNELVKAEKYYRQGLDIARKSVGLRHPKVVSAVMVYAGLLGRTGRYEDGRKLYEELIEARRAAYGPDHILLGECLLVAADFAFDHDDIATRDARLNEAILLYPKVPRDRRVNMLSRNLSLMSGLLISANRPQIAEPFVRESLLLYKKQFGPRSLSVAQISEVLSRCLIHQGKIDGEAESLITESVATYETSFANDPTYPSKISSLARFKIQQKKYDEAELLMRKAFTIASSKFRNEPDTLSSFQRALGDVLALRGKNAEAVTAFEGAKSSIVKAGVGNDLELCKVNASLAFCRLRAGDVAGHNTTVKENLRRFRDTKNPRIAFNAVWTSCRVPGAIDDANDVVKMADNAVTLGPSGSIRPSRSLARIRAGRPEEAIEILNKVKQGNRKLNGWEESVFALALKKAGRIEEAEAAISRVETWLNGPDAKNLDWDDRAELSLLRAEVKAP